VLGEQCLFLSRLAADKEKIRSASMGWVVWAPSMLVLVGWQKGMELIESGSPLQWSWWDSGDEWMLIRQRDAEMCVCVCVMSGRTQLSILRAYQRSLCPFCLLSTAVSGKFFTSKTNQHYLNCIVSAYSVLCAAVQRLELCSCVKFDSFSIISYWVYRDICVTPNARLYFRICLPADVRDAGVLHII